MSVEEFAKRFIQAEDKAWQKGEFGELEKLEDPGVIYHVMAMGQDLVGFEEQKQHIASVSQGVSNLKQDWQYITGESNIFALSYKMSCKFTSEIPGFPPPTGKEMTIDSLFVFRLKDDKVAEAWSNGTITGLV